MTELHVDLSNVNLITCSDNLDINVNGNELNIESLINPSAIDENFNELERRLTSVEIRLVEVARLIENLRNALRN